MSRTAFRPDNLRQYPTAENTVLEGRAVGSVNFSHLPELPLRKGLESFNDIGVGLGAIMLPPPPGYGYNELTRDELRNILNINVFRDKTTYAPGAYLLVPDDVLEQPGRHRPGRASNYGRSGIVSLRDGDTFPVGKNTWLPAVGFDVGRLNHIPYLGRVYSSVHSEQGLFQVRNGELIWTDKGHINRSILIQAPTDSIPTAQIAEQGYAPTRQFDAATIAASGIRSVFEAPAAVPTDLHDATGHFS